VGTSALGGLASGLASGIQLGQEVRRSRQLERYLEGELKTKDLARQGQELAINTEGGGEYVNPYEDTLGDPYGLRLFNWMKSKFGGAPNPAATQATALPGTEQAAASAGGGGYGMGYAEGGMPSRLTAEEVRQRRIQKQMEKEQAAKSKPKTTRELVKQKPVRAGVLAPYAAGVAIPTALSAKDVPTEEYRSRMGLDPSQREGIPRLIEDVGVRTAGVLGDYGNALTGGMAGRAGRAIGGPEAPQQPTASAPAPPTAAQPAPQQGPPSSLAIGARRTATAPASSAVPTQAQVQAQEQGVDWSNVQAMPEDMPTMGTKDWVDYRKKMVTSALMQGKSADEAHQMVDNIQQRGFLREGQSALAYLTGGNPVAAARALKAAYQYFPNGSDVKFGIQENNLIGIGFDEKTNKPKGTPMLINPERLSTMLENFSNPAAFRTWTKDWRDDAFKERKYEEIDKPEAASQMGYRREMAAAARTNAEADVLRARASAAGESKLTPRDFRASEETFRSELKEVGISEENYPVNELATAMAKIRQRELDPRIVSDSEILEVVIAAYEDGTLGDKLADLGIR